MPMARRPFDVGPGARPSIQSERITYFDNSQNVITLHPWTVTLVTITAPVGFLGDRPAIIPASMAAATDGANYCIGTASIRPQAAKAIEFVCTMRAVTWADPKWVMGFTVVNTGITAGIFGGTAPTDYILATKDTGTAHPVIRARKASGTAETIQGTLTGTVDATWLRAHLILTRDSSTAGRGKVDLYLGDDSLQTVPLVASGTIPTQFADTVSLAPGFGWLSGANNTGLSHGMAGWRIYN
jgi:hypothetical protein